MIYSHHGCTPSLAQDVFVAPSSDIVGEVSIGAQSSVWFQVVIRGDVNTIQIGSRTNIQDHSMLHVTRKTHALKVGDDVTVGHRVTLHGCTVGNRVLVGMGATLLDGVEVGDDCMIGAGSLITKDKKIPPRSLVMGAPAKVVRELTQAELAFLKVSAENYVRDGQEYRKALGGPQEHQQKSTKGDTQL